MDMGPPTLPLSAAKHPNGDHLRGVTKQPKYPKCLIPTPFGFCFSVRSAGSAVQYSATSASELTCPIVTSACRVPPPIPRSHPDFPTSQSRNLLV